MDYNRSASPSQRHNPPHIRLNSGSDNLLQFAQQNAPPPPRNATRQPYARSLTSNISPPGSASSNQPFNHPFYSSRSPSETAELLLPPSRSSNRRFRDDDSDTRSPSQSGFNSRRTSWSSEASHEIRAFASPFASPFDDSRTPSRAGSEDEAVNTQTVSEKYNIMPSAGLLLFPEDVEKDDYLHNPDPKDRDPRITCADLCSSRGLVNIGGLALMTLGLLVLFVGYPILTFVRSKIDPSHGACKADPDCIKSGVPLLSNVRTGLIDPDTPSDAMTRTGVEGNTMNLVFSDEFNVAGRTFYDGDDAFYQGVDLWYGVTQDLEWYDPDAISTANGTLNIRFDAFQNHGLNYRSGMLQSWNKLCFKNGYLEASISLPGRGDTSGFWPGFWAMGNLGRPGHAATTDGMWPFSYHDVCDAGVAYNQSDPSGLSYLPAMRLPACTCQGADHPSPGTSRGAPEIDVIEATVTHLNSPVGDAIGSVSQSFQIAPFDVMWRPNTEGMETYNRSLTSINSYQGGPYQQAMSVVTNLNNDWYDGKQYQKYGFEYKTGDDGYIVWNVGDSATWKIIAQAVGPNGNIGQRVIPEEPLSVVANFGMSDTFAYLNLTGLGPLLPATMRFDYIRIYQDEDGEMTCDPDGYPTTDYIAQHPVPYGNANLTEWSQAGYGRPDNSFIDDCTAAAGQSSRQMLKEKRETRQARLRKRSWLPWR